MESNLNKNTEKNCPKCQFDNREGVKFCEECGAGLEVRCPGCGAKLHLRRKFCGECGQKLNGEVVRKREALKIESERKQVTTLFSDLSGYTSMVEKMDPEDVKEIMSRIFGEIAQVVAKYEGFIDKFIGDAVMVLFGIPRAHEDDPVRAIRAAKEIHNLIDKMSPQLEEKIGQTLSMHTGINTGLVVIDKVILKKGTHEVTGDTVILASRLCSLAKAGEILVGPDTFRQAEGYFTFESFEPTRVKGKAEAVRIYKVLSPKVQPRKTYRRHGLRAELIGRSVEMAQLGEAVERIREGKGSILSICGEAGTGKSRLVEEFKTTSDLGDIQWMEAHAYAYSQNIPYWPLIELINRTWHIEEDDSPEQVREKIESGVKSLLGKKEGVAPIFGSLYALSYPEVEDVSPEQWKSRLFKAVRTVLAALARSKPTVILLEDLHWADPSFLELLRYLLSELRYPALFLCLYRPSFNLFTNHQPISIKNSYEEIRLLGLSPSETQDVIGSLLQAKDIPQELRQFIQVMAEGNPLYLEEVVNSLIESETLVSDNDGWKLTMHLSESGISPTVHGVISARLDRLDKDTKRILQEASVIGRAFLYEILESVTRLKNRADPSLSRLEQLDLIRAKPLQPELEYMFKHALTQEVVYNGLLIKERQSVHERIGLEMEQIFHDRLGEFYETLAYHFKRGKSVHKAVDYLVKSGEKSLRRYAVEESHQYFKEAFELLSVHLEKNVNKEEALIDLFIKWSLVYYYRGDYKGLLDLLEAHRHMAESLADKERLGMFYVWLSCALCHRERFQDSYQYLTKALKLGEKTENHQVIGYASTWLTWTCAELGFLDEAAGFAERALKVYKSACSDHYIYFISLAGLGYVHWYRGERQKAFEVGEALVEFGRKHSNLRSMVMGHFFKGFSHLMAGDLPAATSCFQKAIQASADPWYSQFPKLALCYAQVSTGQFYEAEAALQEIVSFDRECGAEIVGTPAQFLLGPLLMAQGHLSKGMKILEDIQKIWRENGCRLRYVNSEYIIARTYAQIAQGARSMSPSTVIKNLGFLVKRVPFAGQKALEHFNRAIEVATEIEARDILGRAYLDLGLFHKAKSRNDQAGQCLSRAIEIFEQSEAEVYLKQAQDALYNNG
jgi:class 3 adenylate cyclase/tetratricopeptide (TPR) repeat protein